MKQLLPLALPSNCYVLHAQERPLYAHGTMAIPEPTMDECNFPEMLARDLDLSSLVFAAKNMTAGPPSRSLAYEEESWHTPATSPRGLHSPALVPPIVRFKSSNLRDAHEASDKLADDQVSLSSSSSASGHCFSEVEPASDVRHQSVVTSATSVTGGRNSALSQKRRNSAGHDTNASWIDFEPELEAAEDINIRTSNIIIPKRPVLETVVQTDVATPAPQRAATATGEDGRSSDPFANFSKPASRTWSLQLQHQRPFYPGQPLDSIEIIVPQRRSSLRNQLEGFNPALLGELLTQAQAAEPLSLPPTPIKATPDPAEEEDETSVLTLEDSKNDIQPWFRYVDRDDDDTPGDSLKPPGEGQGATLPLTPTENVQTWLEDSLESIPLEDQSRRMRLPPEVLDTLRVSTSCFPETMLLCSSLSIETIRSYSRKYKHPAHDVPSRLQTPPPSPKRWKWSNVLGHRRSASSLRPRDSLRNIPDSHDAAAPPTTAPSQPPWPRLRNVFPNGADHLLDTLYAHLVAYTYVSSFCPARGAAAAITASKPLSSELRRPTPRRCSTPDRTSALPPVESPRKSKDSNHDIPRKAASLLGLQDATGSTVTLNFANASLPPPVHPPVTHRLLRKRSSFLDNIRASRLPPQLTAESAPLRELQLALGRCIARIVAALRAGVEGDEAILLLADEDPKVAEIDPVLIRTLCEMVRCCEDNVA
ncbi:hypothetical protein B0T11DRAFT_328603 [Plectosphaerella cucumerina]|uniref:Uncharacterized protein n=1 Tax=Plectosphaerella cucumerina TaxID=40658 RepID=A0A8K0X589_9PEZI|nr:hypothetical protein B0T11DRAFT_328603 [Plectosphaerella cucumerina]